MREEYMNFPGLRKGGAMAGQLTNIVIPHWCKGYMPVRRYNEAVLLGHGWLQMCVSREVQFCMMCVSRDVPKMLGPQM